MSITIVNASQAVTAPDAGSIPRLTDRLQSLLDSAARLIEDGNAVTAFRLLTPPLSALWTESRTLGMADEVMRMAREHRLHALVRQDPFTRRAAEKPRGYAGDAVMLDYIYGTSLPEVISDIGRNVFACTTRSGMGLSVMYRRVLLRSLIDDVVASVGGGRILSVASGHCRELIGSGVHSPYFDGEFVALDQDPESCELVAREQRQHRVRVINQGVRDLMSGAVGELGRFDLVYSAGLYDYLPDALARRLTRRLLSMMAPGGRLLIANFMPGGSGRGYQELFMDWTLIVRDVAEMQALAKAAGADTVRTFVDPHRNVVYAEMQAPAAA
jgi:extracellular factor (EF) 3-hydroxypalmitic acid methyl ester biosynthesis protein